MSDGTRQPEIHRLCASSVSRSLRARLPDRPAGGRVLSAFRRACIIQYGQDDLLALVVPALGNGPLNAVVEHLPGEWTGLQPGVAVQVERNLFRVGRLDVSLDRAEPWEPRPGWESLRASSELLLRRLEPVLDSIEASITGDSLLDFVLRSGRLEPTGEGAVQARARASAGAMWAGWQGDEAQLRAGAAQLAGLGSGLTPAGDDFVLGTMLCAWLAHPAPGRYCETVTEACSPRTTMLSRAFLRSAAAGEFGAAWHCFLQALTVGSRERLEIATREVLAHGHSSGADALAGFLWMGLRHLES
jgi:hypothetical protein